MIPDPILLKAMLIVAKATMIFQAALLFYFYGKDEKVPYAARNIFFVIANAGCLFLAGGIFLENLFNAETVGFLAILKVLIEFLLEIAKLWNL